MVPDRLTKPRKIPTRTTLPLIFLAEHGVQTASLLLVAAAARNCLSAQLLTGVHTASLVAVAAASRYLHGDDATVLCVSK